MFLPSKNKDNGQHFGDHRIPAGKRQAYETDVLVPFLVRGPGVQKGTQSSQVVQSVDLGPTFLDLASSRNTHSKTVAVKSDGELLQSSYPMDGKSIRPLLTNNISDVSTFNDFRWAALLEMYSGSSNIGLRYKDMKEYYHNHMVRMHKTRRSRRRFIFPISIFPFLQRLHSFVVWYRIFS